MMRTRLRDPAARRRPGQARGLLVFCFFLCGAGCKEQHSAAMPPPKVSVARPVEQEVLEWDEYTARLEATEVVEVRSRVSGFLESIHFKDGSIIKKGDLLFTIDPRPYEAARRRAEGELAVAGARLELAQKKSERAVNLVKREAISTEEGEVRSAEARAAEASVAAATAAVEATKLDVEFTKIHAPIAGRVGRKLVTEGNLVNGGLGEAGTLLTTIVSLDPIYAYFEADERSYLKYARMAQRGERPSSREHQNPVRIGLADETGFPHDGYMDFVDNQFDEGTGTMIGRAVLPNPDHLLAPGLFARLQLPGSGKYQALLLPDAALLFDQAESFVWVIDEKNVVQYRRVEVGRPHDGLRIIHKGLEPSDRVIVAGVQRVRPGSEVSPEEVSISTPEAASGATKPPAAAKE
jgi:RND family efflux transporter MFP subunit